MNKDGWRTPSTTPERGNAPARGAGLAYLLVVLASLEGGAGLALLATPACVVALLLGTSPDTPAALIVARLAGVALMALGVACGVASRDAQSRAAFGVLVAMLVYNVGAAGLLLYARVGAGLAGVGLLPAAALHAALAIWCGRGIRVRAVDGACGGGETQRKGEETRNLR